MTWSLNQDLLPMTAHLMTVLTFKHTPGKRTPFSRRTSLFSLWSFLIGLSLAYRNIGLPLAYRSGGSSSIEKIMAAVGLPTAALKVTQYFLIINFRITVK